MRHADAPGPRPPQLAATLPIRGRGGDAHRRHRRHPGESGDSGPRTPACLIAAPPADARTLLIRAESAAALQPDPVPARDQYVHTKKLAQRSLYAKDESGRTLRTKVPVSEERWEAADLDKPWLSRSRNPPATGPVPRMYWDRGAKDIVSKPDTCPGQPVYARLGAWPTDPARVRAKKDTVNGTAMLAVELPPACSRRQPALVAAPRNVVG